MTILLQIKIRYQSDVPLQANSTSRKKVNIRSKQGTYHYYPTTSNPIEMLICWFIACRILGGVTLSPRPDIRCKQNISDFSVCGSDQKEVMIDENYCLSVDHLGRPVDIYHDPDYILRCIGYFKENLKSYLITYDELDPLSVSFIMVERSAELLTICCICLCLNTEISMLGLSTSRSESGIDFTSSRCFLPYQTGCNIMELYRGRRCCFGYDRIRERA